MARRKKGKPWKQKRGAESGGRASTPQGNPLVFGYPDARLDLHGRTVADAEAAVHNFLLTQSRMGSGRIVHVITGKGTGTLFAAVGRFLREEMDDRFDEVAADLQGAGYRVRVR